MGLISKALDKAYWRRHVLSTDLAYKTEQGEAFSGSDRWEFPANSVDWVQFHIPPSVRIRVYARIVSTGGDPFNVDLVRADSVTLGETEFSHSCMNCVVGILPEARLFRGASNPVNPITIEHGFIPAALGPLSSGAIQVQGAYRVLNGSVSPTLLRVENTGGTARTVNLLLVWTEDYA